MYLLIMQFRTGKYRQLLNDLDELAEWMNAVPGLQSKTWLEDAGSNRIGGIYHFDTLKHLLDYKNSDDLHRFRQTYDVTDYQESCFNTQEVDAASAMNRSPYFT